MSRRQQIVSECERLMDEPENIRNIAIAAHVDHGKCIAGGSRITLGDGTVLTARELYRRIRANGEPVDEDGEAFASPGSFDLVSLDRASGETTIQPLTIATRLEPSEPLVRVCTSNGHSLETTADHRYLVLTSTGVMEFKRADAIGPDDSIVGARNVPAREGMDTREALLRSLADDQGCYVTISSAFDARLAACGSRNEPATSPTEIASSTDGDQCGPYHLHELVAACDDRHIPLPELYSATESLTHTPDGPSDESASVGITLPQDPEPLFYLAGVFAGRDPEAVVAAADEALLESVTAAADSVGLETTGWAPGRELRLADGPPALRYLIRTAFTSDRDGPAAGHRLPELVSGATDEEVAGFVRGCADAAGTIEREPPAVVIALDNQGFLADLQLLLYRFDVASHLDHESGELSIYGELSLAHFGAIGFDDSEKQRIFDAVAPGAGSAGVDRVPIDGETLKDLREDADIPGHRLIPRYAEFERNEVGMTKQSLARIVDGFRAQGESGVRVDRLAALAKADTSFLSVESIERIERDYVYDFGVDDHHNFVAEGLIVHNTTLTDNLLAGAGMIADETAGEQLAMDTEEDEQERGITIDAANVSMTHEYEGTNHLINLIDTPGHVDFGGDVTRAMRAVDGALVVVDAVEGAMPQTETVLRQALREGVKPALFINKVDRLISELQEGPDEMQQRLTGVIRDVNDLIRGMTEEREDVEDWTVSVQDGTVAFGSALYKWGVSTPSMQRTGMDFGDIIELERGDKRQELHEQTPLSNVVLDMVCEHFPNPVDAQPRRVPRIWRGDAESDIAIMMRDVDKDGAVVFMVTDISMDPHAGEVATGRVFSGTLEKGQELFVSGTVGRNRLQSVGLFMGGEREEVDRVPAGNIAAVTGLRDAIAGSTVSSEEMTPFESIEHISEPVITKSVEAENMDDLPKLIETLQQVAKEDPTIKIEINEDTGEHLISGQGELHLEVITQRIERNQGIPVRTGEPIVVYREAPQGTSREVQGISPNRHNRFYFSVEPLPSDVVAALKRGEASMDMPELERREALMEAGLDKDTAQEVETIHGTNIVIDDTKGIQHLNETMELIVEGIEEALDDGPLAAEPVQGALLRLHDARLHEDAIHRGPAQVIPAVRRAIHDALIDADVKLLEPIQDVRLDVPNEYMGPASGEIQGRRGRVDDMYQEGDLMVVEGVAPVEEMIGFSSDIRSATEGRASWNTENAGFQVMADNLQPDKIIEIRERKGMKTELPEAVDYF